MTDEDFEKMRVALDQAAADRNERLLADGKPLMLIIRPATEQKLRMTLKGMEMLGFPVPRMRESILEDVFIRGINALCEDLVKAGREVEASDTGIAEDMQLLFGHMEKEVTDNDGYRARVREAREKCRAFKEYGPAACCSKCKEIDCPSYMRDR